MNCTHDGAQVVACAHVEWRPGALPSMPCCVHLSEGMGKWYRRMLADMMHALSGGSRHGQGLAVYHGDGVPVTAPHVRLSSPVSCRSMCSSIGKPCIGASEERKRGNSCTNRKRETAESLGFVVDMQ